MKELVVLACLMIFSVAQAQIEPTYEQEGQLVKATYYYEDGKIKEQGFFKNKNLEGTWVTYDKNGNKTAIAHYSNGKKAGKWFLWQIDGLKEIDYENSVIANVQHWKEETKIAIK